MSILGQLRVLLSAESKDFDRDLGASKRAIGELRMGVRDMATAFGLGAISIGSVVKVLADSSKEAAEAERIGAKLEAVMKATGNSVDMTRDELDDLATSLSTMTGVEDDSITNAEALLLTFRNIGRETFPEALEAALDLSATFDQDLKSSVVQVGKALNDPSGMAAMKRIGVSFTDAQMDMARAMFEAGDMAGYQKVIMEELQVEVGGAAEMMGNTFAGSLDRAKVGLGNVKEELGLVINEGIRPAIDALDDLANSLVNSMGVERQLVEAMEQGIITESEANYIINKFTWTSYTAADAQEWLADRTDMAANSYETYAKKLLASKVASNELSQETADLILASTKNGGTQAFLMEQYGGMTEEMWNAVEGSQMLTDWYYRQAWAMEDLTESTEEGTEATFNYDQAMKDLELFIKGPMGEAIDDFKSRQEELNERAAELVDEIAELEGKSWLTKEQKEQLEGLKGDLQEVQGEIEAEKEAHNLKTKSILLDLLIQRAALVEMTDGGKEAFLSLTTDLAEKWGLIDSETAEMVKGVDDTLASFGNGEGYLTALYKMDVLRGRVNAISGTHDVIFNVSTVGSSPYWHVPPGVDTGNPNPDSEWAEGGTHWAMQPELMLVGEAGPELVTVTPQSQMGGQVNNNFNMSIYTNSPTENISGQFDTMAAWARGR